MSFASRCHINNAKSSKFFSHVGQLLLCLHFAVIQNPLMPKDKLDFVRTQLLSSIERRGDNVRSLKAIKEFYPL